MLDTSKVRYLPPNRLDQAPFGSTVYVDSEKEGLMIYIQLSEDFQNPDWRKGRNLLEVVFQDFLRDPKFMELCIKIFKDKQPQDYKELGNIILLKYGDRI